MVVVVAGLHVYHNRGGYNNNFSNKKMHLNTRSGTILQRKPINKKVDKLKIQKIHQIYANGAHGRTVVNLS